MLKIVLFLRAIPSMDNIEEYHMWGEKAREIARQLQIQVDYYPLYEGKFARGLMDLHSKMEKWKTENPKLYNKYKKKIDDIEKEFPD